MSATTSEATYCIVRAREGGEAATESQPCHWVVVGTMQDKEAPGRVVLFAD